MGANLEEIFDWICAKKQGQIWVNVGIVLGVNCNGTSVDLGEGIVSDFKKIAIYSDDVHFTKFCLYHV